MRNILHLAVSAVKKNDGQDCKLEDFYGLVLFFLSCCKKWSLVLASVLMDTGTKGAIVEAQLLDDEKVEEFDSFSLTIRRASFCSVNCETGPVMRLTMIFGNRYILCQVKRVEDQQ